MHGSDTRHHRRDALVALFLGVTRRAKHPMTLLIFASLAAINVTLLVALIRKRGWNSVEGWCSVYLLLIVLSDNVEVFIRALLCPETLPLGAADVTIRIYPTIIHILGITVFWIGLTLADPRPRPIVRFLTPPDLRKLTHIGVWLVAIGTAMYVTAVYLMGAAAFGVHTLDAYRTDVLASGSFWY